MSSQKPPSLPPMSDEGYYVRDPRAVFVRIDTEFRTFAAHLLALAGGVKAADAALPLEQYALA